MARNTSILKAENPQNIYDETFIRMDFGRVAWFVALFVFSMEFGRTKMETHQQISDNLAKSNNRKMRNQFECRKYFFSSPLTLIVLAFFVWINYF